MQKLIDNQHRLPAEARRYGLRSSAVTGCGWVAIYNALELMGYHMEPQELIRFLEHQAPGVNGNFGTMLWSPAACLHRWGFPTGVTVRRERFDEAAKDAAVCILFYRWRNGMKFGAHFVALHHTPEGFVGYNTFRNSVGPDRYGPSLEQWLRRRHYFGAVLTTVQPLKNKSGI